MNDTFTWKLIKELTDKNVLGAEGLVVVPTNTRKTARAIVIDKDGLYAVMYAENFGLHSLPGGGMEDGESPETALRREILEETGCSCDIIEPLGIITENRFHANYTAVSYYFVVKCTGEKNDPQLTQAELDNGTMLKWCSFDDLMRFIRDVEHTTNQRKFLQARDIAALEEYQARFLSP